MSEKVDINSLGRAVNDIVSAYSAEVAEAAKKAVEKTTCEAIDVMKARIPGKVYTRNITFKTAYEDSTNKRNTIFVKGKHYRLSHLLERTHRTRYGHTRIAYHHFEEAQNYVDSHLEENVRREIEEIS